MTKTLALILAAAAVIAGLPLGIVLLIGGLFAGSATTIQPQIDCTGIPLASGTWRTPVLSSSYRVSSDTTSAPGGVRIVPATAPADIVATTTGILTTLDPATGSIELAPAQHSDIHQTVGTDEALRIRYTDLTLDPHLHARQQVTIGETLGHPASATRGIGFVIARAHTPIDTVAFLHDHGAPLDGRPIGAAGTTTGIPSDTGEGGLGFPLPTATAHRLYPANPPAPIPARIEQLYRSAATTYAIPWTLLAGIGMEESSHGRAAGTSSAGAEGLMQFLPSTFTIYGVDGDHDGTIDIHDDADSIYSAAHYLVASGVRTSPDGVRTAIYAYNHADWYVGDVLSYAHAYGGGTIPADGLTCPHTATTPIPPLTDDRIGKLLNWAITRVGLPYVMGANGPDAYDCSSFVQAAYATINIRLPRTAATQRDWLAAGNGTRVPIGSERPGDLIFTDSYLGPNTIGHVAIVVDPTDHTTVEAANQTLGIITGTYSPFTHHNIFEIWRVGNVSAGHSA